MMLNYRNDRTSRSLRQVIVGLALTTALLLLAAGAGAQSPPKTHLKVGDPAPDFTLIDTKRQPVKLSDFKGKKSVVLAFYVLAFTGGWTKELQAYQADIAKFDATETQVLGISVDSFAANGAFAEKIGVTFPLLSDFKRTVSQAYGIYNEAQGFATRATFVVDKEGIIRHIEQGNTAIDPTGAYQVCSAFPKKKE
jgi:mycoredoxin-dependent peroxiredoxin